MLILSIRLLTSVGGKPLTMATQWKLFFIHQWQTKCLI